MNMAGTLQELLKLLSVGGLAGAGGAGAALTGGRMMAPGAAPPVDPRLGVIQQMQQGGAGRPVPMLDPAAREAAMGSGDLPLQDRARQNLDALSPPAATFNQRYVGEWDGPRGGVPSARDKARALEMSNDSDADTGPTPIYGEYADHFGGNTADHDLLDGDMTTEEELDATQKAMGTSGATDFSDARRRDANWEGPVDGVPSKRDQAMLDRSPTDGMINSFIKRFPTWADQNGIAQDGQGLAGSDGSMAIDEEELDNAYKKRKTRIDER